MFQVADYPAFRATFVRLRYAVSVYERINIIVDWRKTKRKAMQVPRSAWYDGGFHAGSGRSTKGEEVYSHHIILRPTEILALMAAAGGWNYGTLPERVELSFAHREKYCQWCELHKPLKEFARDKRFSDGRHAYCNSCRAELQQAKWYPGVSELKRSEWQPVKNGN